MPRARRTPDSRHDTLVSEAWRLVQEGLEHGTLTLKSGKVCVLDHKDQLRHVQWLASMGKKRTRGMPLPKDVFVSPTR